MASSGIAALTDRERQTLRLLAHGHDAKSIARDLGLSIHTVNERLRDARRKLGVTSSREAARMLVTREAGSHELSADEDFGVANDGGNQSKQRSISGGATTVPPLAWIGGGMIVMSLLVAAAVLLPAHPESTKPPQSEVAAPVPSASIETAQRWLALLDGHDWDASWRDAAAPFKAQLTAAQWAAMIRPIRDPLGSVSVRTLSSATSATTLPGVPPGHYVIAQFTTAFTHRSAVVETVTLSLEMSGWHVAGYFIR